ncbi:hypothetical protein ABMA28_009876, partial [Loxostege sticticalis]
MRTQPAIELANLTKWNSTTQSDLIITENINITDTYHVTASDDPFIEQCDNYTSDNVSVCESNSNYDSIEISVVIVLFLLIVVTVIGNTLIISAVVTTKRLRTVTNCFVTSLAVADLLVGIFVMPPAIAVHITGKYEPDHNQGGVCRYNQNPGYVVFSAMGSFFLPMAVMVYVYARISCVVARRHHQLASTATKCSK